MSNYLIELSVIHVALILGYWLFLRNERQYTKMRFYLIASALLALCIPLLKLPKLFFRSNEPMEALIVEVPMDVMPITATAEVGWSLDILLWMPIAISLLFLIRFLGSVLYLIHLERTSSYVKFNDLYIRRVRNRKGSFTFFNWIFVSDEINLEHPDNATIVKHEQAHVSLRHTYDLVFFELFKVCFWWLPTTWFSIREIKKIHEYQADAQALKTCTIDHYSSILINSALKSNGLSLVNSFHDGSILKRLQAMKQQAKNVSPWKLGALSTLCTLLLILFACTEEKRDETSLSPDTAKHEGEIFTVVEELPGFEGGMDAFYQYVAKEIRYPLQERQMGVEGRVDVQFVVEKDGSLSDIKVIKGIGPGCDDEAVRVMENAPLFKPGTQRGMPVRVRMVVPIVFQLNKGVVNKDNSTQGIIWVEEVRQKSSKLKVDVRFAGGEWVGTVRDPEGEVLPGAHVIVVGTTTGAITTLDGFFRVKANESDFLFVSFVGYESVRVGYESVKSEATGGVKSGSAEGC